MFINVKNTVVLISLLLAFMISSSGQKTNRYITHYTTESGLSHNRVEAIIQDKTGFIWFATWNGLCRFDGNDFVNYQHDPDNSTSLPHFAINNVCCDRYNNIWVTSNDKGIGLYDRRNNNFIYYYFNGKGKSHIQSEDVSMCLDTSRTLWIIGIKKGVVEKYDQVAMSFREINVDRHIPNSNNKFPEINGYAMTFDNKNKIWFYNGEKLFLADLITTNNELRIQLISEFLFEREFSNVPKMMICTNDSGSILCISETGLYYC